MDIEDEVVTVGYVNIGQFVAFEWMNEDGITDWFPGTKISRLKSGTIHPSHIFVFRVELNANWILLQLELLERNNVSNIKFSD